MSSVSTDGWFTYKSQYGYEIKYPQYWTVFNCMNGVQVFFYVNTVAPNCDGEKSGDVSIVGPLSVSDIAYINALPSRITQNVLISGAEAIRYTDIYDPETGNLGSDLFLIDHGGKYFEVAFGDAGYEPTILEEKMVSTFQFTK